MSPERKFRQRATEVRAYLRSLQDLESNYKRPGRGFYRALATISASRAAVFIMIYNCVEHSIRESLAALRMDIETERKKVIEISQFWQKDLVRIKITDKLRQGMNHDSVLNEIILLSNCDAEWGDAKSALTFPGNIDHDRLLRLAKDLGVVWRPPKGTLGGVDLDMVRRKRNDLAHGQDTFENVGSAIDTEKLYLLNPGPSGTLPVSLPLS